MTRQRPLSSDALGRRGERQFGLICAEPGIVANKSYDQDAAGWDYIVDFLLSQAPNNMPIRQSLDERLPPITCRVQVKSMWADNDRVALKLSTLNRLASDPGPTLIYVLKYDEDLTVTGSYVIHLLDENLARILERLRIEDHKGRSVRDLNGIELSYVPSRDGLRLPTTGAALKQALTELVGGEDGLTHYVAEKERQRQTLGYDEIVATSSVTFKTDWAGFVDGFLGLQPLQVPKFDLSTVRFGIPRPQFDTPLKNVVMHISPTKPDRCKLIARPSNGSPALIFDVERRVPGIPGLPPEHFKALLLGELFEFSMTLSGFHFTGTAMDQAGAHRVAEWCRYFNLLTELTNTPVDFELVHPTDGTYWLARSYPQAFIPAWDVAETRNILDCFCQAASSCAADFGKLNWNDIEAAADDIRRFTNCMSSPADHGIRVGVRSEPPEPIPFEILYIKVLPVGASLVAYAMRSSAVYTAGVSVESGTLELMFTGLEAARVIANLDADYTRFKETLGHGREIMTVMEHWSERLEHDPGSAAA